MLKDNGIILKKSAFYTEGICIYEDEHGNSVFCKREDNEKPNEQSFKAKLRFANSSVKAGTIHVTVPVIDGTEGQNLSIDYPSGTDLESEDIQAGIKLYTFILQRWIDIMYDILFSKADVELIQRANEGAEKEDVAREQLSRLADYEELSDVVLPFMNHGIMNDYKL